MALPLSSNPLNVAVRTLTGSNPSHSLKAAETAARCAHTCQGSKPATEASGGVWRVICGAYGLGKNRSRPNGLHHLARNGRHQLARTSEHQLARTSEHHKPWRTSRHHTRPARVGITNPGAQFFILKAANPRMIRGFYGVQFFISEKLMNGKRIVHLYYYAGRRIAAWTSPLDTHLAGP